jgi:membrane associated rhomboid family serine protease
MLFVLVGLHPGSDVAAHLGGFVAGTVLGFLLALDGRLAARPIVNSLAALLLATLIVGSWRLALRSP